MDGTTGMVLLWWLWATDDLTPVDALTYDLELYRNGAPAKTPRRPPDPGGVGAAFNQWTQSDLPVGFYSWAPRAVDGACNGGPSAASTFFVGESTMVFADGFESGDLSQWSAAVP